MCEKTQKIKTLKAVLSTDVRKKGAKMHPLQLSTMGNELQVSNFNWTQNVVIASEGFFHVNKPRNNLILTLQTWPTPVF